MFDNNSPLFLDFFEFSLFFFPCFNISLTSTIVDELAPTDKWELLDNSTTQ